MADIVSPEVRSRMMASIKGKDTKPEMLVRQYLHGRGFRYSLSSKRLPGKPDLTLSRHNVVVLVHGCYWHGHQGCRYATTPTTRAEFWRGKIMANRERDARVLSELRARGWRTSVVWECALKQSAEPALGRLEQFILSTETEIEISSVNRS
ncbi:very short patch repair endonuclease [Luteimonas chenhongjianii]|uniref:Very short patch repair endonuclease n=1 Tax=Luteimonas chenhongjianii TaxID=2006110 RepID=A0A290XEC2_9GAMM|nr:very short patch repair endonuclease [Luteimonas chenhongjianii]ATD67514.1 very short patch repair endonuclease [Luteimonas chenhongjianii]